MSERFVLVMAGGSGSRLWPASTQTRPKHLLGIGPEAPTLLDATLSRARAWLGDDRTWVITTAAQRAAIIAAHPELPPAQIIAEPRGRNTAPAIAFALLHIRAHLDALGVPPQEAVVVALPADHHIAAPAALQAALERATDQALRRQIIVTLGIEPTAPDTGYGYIERSPEPRADDPDLPPLYPVQRFVEKPDAERARAFIERGRFLWNAGIFVLPLATALAAFNTHAPTITAALRPVEDALRSGDADAVEAASLAAYAELPATPIDVAVMEKLRELDVLPVTLGWNDLGSWTALHAISPQDASGNASLGDRRASIDTIDCEGSIFWSEGIEIVAIGVRDLAVIACDGKLLICPLARAQEVRDAARISAARSAAKKTSD